MAHATLNGITIPGAKDTFAASPEYIGDDFSRSTNGDGRSTMTARLRRWQLSCVPQTAAIGEALAALVDGLGHSWSFDADLLSFKGLGPSAGSHSQSASGGKHGGKLVVNSGSKFEVALAEHMARSWRSSWAPSFGWTLMCWKRLSVGDGGDGTTYYHHIATGAVNVTRGSSANPAGVTQYRNGVAGSYSMGNWIELASDGDVGVHGYDNAGVAAAYDYDDLVVLPFALPASWAAGIYSFCSGRGWSDMPQLVLGGDCVPETSGVVVVGRARRIEQRGLMLDGAWRNNARALELELMEA